MRSDLVPFAPSSDSSVPCILGQGLIVFILAIITADSERAVRLLQLMPQQLGVEVLAISEGSLRI